MIDKTRAKSLQNEGFFSCKLLTIDKIRAKIPNANNLQLNTDKPSKGLLAQILGALSRRRLSKSAPFFYSYAKKEGESHAERLLFFLTQAKRGGKMERINLYVIYEFLNEKWEQRNVFNTYGKALDFIYQAREWEKRWKEQGFEYAPAPGIYKIVRFTENVTFTIED